ncbi:hypothetical protein M430DRAFT_229122 [Amorphotheca resinae ATCC 22711]|uniref:Uncharacterized protein n=1 Tax=Amorphotheca resinae ATCC 22711 TaxID=857342 RepID=A0A2T3B367_AMORE|nr:hypothetical protein M430DRAFT_229122 [Amorphotheca resinae ATCC 22711]PSS20080.1 hypothetical protein M430DRAFT_229122 [Amorphotheca resinae ATCC 22711]
MMNGWEGAFWALPPCLKGGSGRNCKSPGMAFFSGNTHTNKQTSIYEWIAAASLCILYCIVAPFRCFFNTPFFLFFYHP